MSTPNLSNRSLRGYISSRNINGSFYPQNLQNLLIRSYSNDNKIKLQLSGTEWNIKKSFLMLRSIINQKNNGVIFFSLFQIFETKSSFKYFAEKIINKKKILVFCLENIIITKKKDIDKILRFMKIYEINKSNNYLKNVYNLKRLKKNFK
tara:strand:- start:811 stop:1260 length:450 start_codon:yes stop_codon:yes gene_type:complete